MVSAFTLVSANSDAELEPLVCLTDDGCSRGGAVPSRGWRLRTCAVFRVWVCWKSVDDGKSVVGSERSQSFPVVIQRVTPDVFFVTTSICPPTRPSVPIHHDYHVIPARHLPDRCVYRFLAAVRV